VLNVARLALAALAVVAMAYQFFKTGNESGFTAANFFSFFTIQSNLLGVAALVALALVARDRRTPIFDGTRSAVVLYMALVGIVFALLLSGLQEELQTTTPWVDFVVHKLMPVALVADWLLDPPRHRLPWWTVPVWLAFPLVWLTYTLVRGEAEDWYPYPFVDVSELGYDGVLARSVGLTAGFMLAGAAVLWLGNRRARD
jgi:hypothetical protein